MEKFGFAYTNNMNELICTSVYQKRGNEIIELMVVGVEDDEGNVVKEIEEMETDFNSFEELEDYYFNRKSQAVLIFKEFPSISEAIEVIGKKMDLSGK